MGIRTADTSIRKTVAVAIAGATAIVTVLATSPVAGAAVHPEAALTAQGSTFSAKLIQQWAADVSGQGLRVTYTGSSSGSGRTAFVDRSADFAGSDVPFGPADAGTAALSRGGVVYVPAVAGGIALMFRLQGVSEIKLSGPTIAKIFSGAITNWSDPAITADNGTALPSASIRAFVRSGNSGTSSVMTGYLSAAGGGIWTGGVVEAFPTSGGQIAVAGSDGVADNVKNTEGGIGYAEVGFATERGLAVVSVKNAAGQFTKPTAAAVSAALGEATLAGDATVKLAFTASNPAAYPLATVSYIIAPGKSDPAKADNLKEFLTYANGPGQAKAAALGYAPVPDNIKQAIAGQIDKIGS
jgi:phosphate transport system substrate-binding protein